MNDYNAWDVRKDFLNFSPSGGIEILKQLAVQLEIPDTRKRKLISEKTGFNIDNAIYVNKIMADDDDANESVKPVTRKAAPVNSTGKTRKVSPQYNVTSISE